MDDTDFEAFFDGFPDSQLSPFIPLDHGPPGRLVTSDEATDLALNVLLGDGASDHARRRWSDVDPSKPSLVWHPFTTQGKWIEGFSEERQEILRKGTEYVARHFRYACLDGYVSGYVRAAATREWFRVPRSYWSSHRSGGDALPARLRLDDGKDFHHGIDHSLIVFADDQVSEWAATQFKVLARRVAEGGSLPTDDDDEDVTPFLASDRTGAAGRPSSRHHALRILEQRAAKGLLAALLKDEAAAVNAEFNAEDKLRGLARMTDDTVSNAIRGRYRELKAIQSATK